jgi:tetratricopeptide (TPR) repeat protein
MDNKYQVFISSTSRDLPEHRKLAIDACINADMFPIAMEYFQPENATALQVCYDALQKADLFVGIYTHRYGHAPDSSATYTDKDGNIRTGDGKTGITEWEYIWAKEMDMPIVIFVIDADADWKVSHIEHAKKAQLDAFKDKVGGELVYKTFTTIEDFHVKIISALKDRKTQQRVETFAFSRLPTPEQIKEREKHALITASSPPPSPIKDKIRRIGSLPKVFTDETFYDRASQQADITNAIHDRKALIAVYGRGGVGKTALMCKVLGDFEKHTPPADGLAYFRADKTPLLTAGEIFEALAHFLPADHAFHEFRKDITVSISDKTRALIEAMQGGRYILYIDNLESLQLITHPTDASHDQPTPLSPDEGHITEAGIRELLHTILSLGDKRGLSVVITSRAPLPFGDNPLFFDNLHSHYHKPIRLDDGLPLDEGLAFMGSMDTYGSLPKDKTQLAQWHAKVLGFPRGLEALVGYLNEGETRSIQDLLDDPRLFGNRVLNLIVGKVIETLPLPLKRVLGAVSVIGQTATQADLEYALAPHVDTAHLRHALDRLVAGRYLAYNQLTRTYSLHPLDIEYISTDLLPEGEKPIRGWDKLRVANETAFTKYALAYRMAGLYHQKGAQNTVWKSLDDLTPHLREMEYRMLLADYDTVADILTDMDFEYLLLWGYTELVLQWHTRLEGLVQNPRLAMECIGNLGWTYYLMGRVEKAITYTQKAIDTARAQGDKGGECAWLNNLGLAYSDLGQVETAIGYYQDALVIARETQYRRGEGAILGNLGIAYSDLGQRDTAIDYYQQALVINREAKDKRSEGNQLGNLGVAYSDLGQQDTAIDYYQQALAIAREIQDKAGEGRHLGNLGVAYGVSGQLDTAIDYYQQALAIAHEIKDKRNEGNYLGNLGNTLTLLGRYTEAIAHLRDSIEIVTAIKAPDFIQSNNSALANAHWFSGDMPNALTAIHKARMYDIATNNHAVASLHGCIAFCAGHVAEAQTAFTEALAHADALLAKSANQYGAMYSRALAHAGLWVVTGDTHHHADALKAYGEAKGVNSSAGTLLSERQGLEALLRCSDKGGSALVALLQ